MLDKISRFFLPPARSTIAHSVDNLFSFITLVSVIILIGITVAIIYFIIKYRQRSDDDVTSLVDHNNALEVTWSIIPLALVLIVFSWGFRDYIRMFTPPSDAYEINVTAQQWLWKFTYPNGKTSVSKLYVPQNRPVKLVMKSKDVIHSFFVPDFRVKHDVLPDRYTDVWFQAPDTGRSQIFCTQYCGTGHSDMLGTVIVQTNDQFEKWLKQGAGGKPAGMSLADYGKQLYGSQGCKACHSTDGSRIVGPTWKGLYGSTVHLSDGTTVTADDNYIRRSVLDPGAQIVQSYPNVMPTFQGQLNDEQINAIIAYIKSLK